MTSQDFILRVDCRDQPGIVAAVASCLQDNNFNIEDASQFSDKLSGRFFMRMVVRPQSDNKTTQNFANSFGDVANDFEMDWDVHPEEENVRALIMVSREDHCLNHLLYKTRTGHLPLDIVAIASNHDNNKPLAERYKLPFHHLPITKETKQAQEAQITDLIEETGAELVVLARYMQILTDDLCSRYAGRIINIHHSFLPGFKGAKPYHQAYERGVKIIGATAHFATHDLDEGPIIEQETARIDHSMDADDMRLLGQDIESRVLTNAIKYYAQRRVFLHGNRTVIL